MKTLLEIQKAFASAVRGSGLKEFSESVIPGGRLNPHDCVQVYRDGYTARLTSALGETYETVWRILGDEEFFRASGEYIKQNDSVSYNLSDYGGSFPEFLRERYSALPFLASLGAFELLFKEVFHAENSEPLDLSAADLSCPEQIRFLFSKDAAIFRSRHSIFHLWQNRDKEEFTLPEDSQLNQPENCLLFKKGFAVYCESLNQDECTVLELMMQGCTIPDAVAVLEGADESFVSGFFSRIAGFGIISGIEMR